MSIAVIITTFPAVVILALCHKESGNNPRCGPGDGGLARGILQIHSPVIEDVNRVYGTKYVWPRDADDADKAKEICALYLAHWGSKERLGHEPTPDDYARIWNGGPHGAVGGYREKTEAYAQDFAKIYNREDMIFNLRLKELSKSK